LEDEEDRYASRKTLWANRVSGEQKRQWRKRGWHEGQRYMKEGRVKAED
jgi:hypothetical protein